METKRRHGRGGPSSKLTRTEVLTVRLDPRLRFAVELAARLDHRTASAFIERAIEEKIEKCRFLSPELADDPEMADMDIPLKSAVEWVWDVDEPDRFVKMALFLPDLLNYDEQVLWKRICECDALWLRDAQTRQHLKRYELREALDYPALRERWASLLQQVTGETSSSVLPRPTLQALPGRTASRNAHADPS